MPIQSDDIKLLKSAVMADVPEGGGPATGIEIEDGRSNNIWNDISTDDRANGAAHFRKVYGIAQTDDTDLLLGAGFSVMQPPEDPNVSVLLFQTPGWFDERTDAISLVERYLVKGPRLVCRIADVHYTGTNLLQLYNIADSGFPSAGDAITLVNPGGQEQYVRVLKTAQSTAVVQTDDGGPFTVHLCTCTLNKALVFDLQGRPIQRVSPTASTTAWAYSTSPAQGAVFYGCRALALEALTGSRTVYAEGGILASLVPASTVPEPVIDQYPLVQRATLSRTAASALTIPAQTLTLGPGTVLQLPTAVEPGSLTMSHGGTGFTANAAGDVLQGAVVVGALDAAGRTLTMLGSAPSYGSASNTITYRPATRTGATAHSIGVEVTEANQSLAWVFAMEPTPAPGTLSFAYMFQGRWYELLDDGTGKVSGADTSYGSGTLQYVTGSLGVTTGALPDVGSAVIIMWGEADSAEQATGLPARAWSYLPLQEFPDGNILIEWSRGATAYSATVTPAGVVTGPGQARAVELQADDSYRLPFSPDVLPDAPIALTYTPLAAEGGFVNDGGGSYTLNDGNPIKPGSVRFRAIGTASGSEAGEGWAGGNRVYDCYSDGTEVYARGLGVIGTINNTNGAMVLSHGGMTVSGFKNEKRTWSPSSGNDGTFGTHTYTVKVPHSASYNLGVATITTIQYQDAAGSASPLEDDVLPEWLIEATPPEGASIIPADAAFLWSGALHFSRDGVVFKGWHPGTGATQEVGAITDMGRISLGISPPDGGGSNAVTWHNLARDKRGALDVFDGVFRTPVAPLQAGQFQLMEGSRVGTANSGGVISGEFDGWVDSQRGIVWWAVDGLGEDEGEGVPIRADQLTYNAVFLQYVPIDIALLGVDTTRLPVDGRVPIFHEGRTVVVHHTDTTQLPNPITKGTSYDLGRERIAHVTLRDAAGQRVPGELFEVDHNPGTLVVPVDSDITEFTQPFTAYHRIEDELNTNRVDLSGRLDLAAQLTHDYPAGESYISGKLRLGDRFARVHNVMDRATWNTAGWDATAAGSDTAAQFNQVDYPITTTNRGAITERWAFIFTSTTHGRVIGEGVGQVLTNVPIAALIEAVNPQTSAPYFSIPPEGWGGGWAVGNVLLWETQAAGGPVWGVRAVQPGASAVLDDVAVIALRSDVDRP